MGGESVAQEPRAGLGLDAARRLQRLADERRPAQQHRRPLAVGEQARDALDRLGRNDRRRDVGQPFGRALGRAPGAIGGHDQRRHAAGRGAGGLHGARRVAGDGSGVARPPHPGRDRAREADDVGGQRRVVAHVVDRVVADDVDDRRRRAARVVQIGEPVGEAGAEMQERRGRLSGDAAVAVGGAGGDALEQAQHAAQARVGIERADQMHFGSAGIGETNLHAAVDQRLRERLRAVHLRAPSLVSARAV